MERRHQLAGALPHRECRRVLTVRRRRRMSAQSGRRRAAPHRASSKSVLKMTPVLPTLYVREL